MAQNGTDKMEKLKKIAFGEKKIGLTWANIANDQVGGGHWTSPVVGLGGCSPRGQPRGMQRLN